MHNQKENKNQLIMEIPIAHKRKYFYHFTHIENLESIVKNGLLSINTMTQLGLNHVNVASESIQQRRSEMDVTCTPGGKIHDYVPFYFTSINPMLLSIINSKIIDQPFIIFIAIHIDKILEDNVVFTDASANTTKPPNFYSDPKNLTKLDWEAIESKRWGTKDSDELHRRMSEVLVYEKVTLDWIDSIIVWNEPLKDITIQIFKDNGLTPPNISYDPFHDKHFYFTKFFIDRHKESLVTGPYYLKSDFTKTIKSTLKKIKSDNTKRFLFNNIEDALNKTDSNFCEIKELEDIYELETENEVHTENVSDHTKKVVGSLEKNSYYTNLSKEDKNIVKFSAYIHDIGKGPKSKWKNGKQSTYQDHPADSLQMLKRILTEDFKELSEYEIKKICLLVAYHDLIGDILERGRNKQELIDIIKDEQELNMLIAISLADLFAINSSWYFNIKLKLPKFVSEIKQEIK